MKKVFTVLLACLICFAGCNAPTESKKESFNFDSYMGAWQIYTNSEADGDSIGTVTFAKTGEDTISVEIADFIGGVDITGVKNAQFAQKDIGIAHSLETVKVDDGEIVLYFNFEKDENLKESVVIDFIIPGNKPLYALESLYLIR